MCASLVGCRILLDEVFSRHLVVIIVPLLLPPPLRCESSVVHQHIAQSRASDEGASPLLGMIKPEWCAPEKGESKVIWKSKNQSVNTYQLPVTNSIIRKKRKSSLWVGDNFHFRMGVCCGANYCFKKAAIFASVSLRAGTKGRRSSFLMVP